MRLKVTRTDVRDETDAGYIRRGPDVPTVTDPIHRCSEHGFTARVQCPVCGATGETVLSSDGRERLSKFVSGALRHFPDDAGLSLDERGWARYDDLVHAVAERYDWADADALEAVVETDPKGRFEREGDRIRAAYGHSVDVTLEDGSDDVPDRLYHGTAPRNVESIMRDGLQPMERREVHLSARPEDALAVGRRHTDEPALLAIDADGMRRDGLRATRRAEGTYTADGVPPEYVERRDPQR